MKGITISWDARPDPSRAAWKIYLAQGNEKGSLIALLDPDEESHTYYGVKERDYTVRVLAVNKAGVEESWENAGKARHKVKVTAVVPAKPTNGGVQVVNNSVAVKAVTSAAGKTDPSQKIEVIRGADPYVGQSVGEATQERDDKEGEAGSRRVTFGMPASPGRGPGNQATYTVRGVTVDGKTPGPSYTSVNLPHFNMPNHTATTLASIVGTTITNFPTPANTSAWAVSGTSGFMLRKLPMSSGATLAWGTSGSGLLASQPSGAYWVTSTTVTSATLDVGALKVITLECYDEMQRSSSTGIFDTLMSRDAVYPADPLSRDPSRVDLDSPMGVARTTDATGRPIRPVPRTRWEYRWGHTTALTGGGWQEAVPGAMVRTRYLQARFHASEPSGFYQVCSPRVIVRAWEEHATALTHVEVLTKGSAFTVGELAQVDTGGKAIGIRTDAGNRAIVVNIGGVLYSAALS